MRVTFSLPQILAARTPGFVQAPIIKSLSSIDDVL